MSTSITGKTAIVTGAANGVGLAIARHFLAQGANVVFADMDEKRLKNEVGKVTEDDSPCRIFSGDLRQKLTVTNLLSATIDAFDRVDILVNAARQVEVTDPMNPDDTTVETLLQQNLMSALRLTQMVSRRMIKQAAEEERTDGQIGSIVNLSSITSRATHPDLMGFSISAAALEQMTRSMALVLAPERIRVNALAFGSVMSASLKRSLKDQEDLRKEIAEITPLRRIAKASELADTVQFLASEASSFMTGQVVTVDGGRTLLDAIHRSAH
ncbi:SDR family NAD(P)-dependent oxidoreductase [Brevirhabdus sp.]|uniref:SDR family NAD(P)-dependent oxidoreductase n=1 Tax=Brevirhabdus sp. TaxID=2004514 RepID=UPI0040585675